MHYVAVISNIGVKLMPTTVGHARKLLKSGRARIYKHKPVFVIQQYAAFITQHAYPLTDSDIPNAVDIESCKKDFPKFIKLQEKEIQRLKSKNTLNFYIQGM